MILNIIYHIFCFIVYIYMLMVVYYILFDERLGLNIDKSSSFYDIRCFYIPYIFLGMVGLIFYLMVKYREWILYYILF